MGEFVMYWVIPMSLFGLCVCKNRLLSCLIALENLHVCCIISLFIFAGEYDVSPFVLSYMVVCTIEACVHLCVLSRFLVFSESLSSIDTLW